MFFKTYLIAGILATLFFGVAQHRGWDLFAKTATAQTASSGGHGPGGRIYHK